MDIQLPEVSGLEVTKWIKEDEDIASIPVIAVTAFAMKDILEATGLYRVTLLNPYKELMPHLDLLWRPSGRRGPRGGTAP